uniref:Uncharacterized protein n=1 Tax=Firmicutes phage HS08 TaxID=3056391 RepID=A0AA49X4V9_9VIRU|nr:MAG: hypothetical protein [Firmicutes phage HS08]
MISDSFFLKLFHSFIYVGFYVWFCQVFTTYLSSSLFTITCINSRLSSIPSLDVLISKLLLFNC